VKRIAGDEPEDIDSGRLKSAEVLKDVAELVPP
jgi:hypothetical protein